MKKISTIILVLYCSLGRLYSQTAQQALLQLPVETVYLHSNTGIALAGEYLYYQFYTLLHEEGTLSPISKIGYVDLVNEDQEVVFHHKLKLIDGTAASEFFIPAAIPSGNYKLVGYTQWMRNLGPDSFFTTDLTILNPYRGDQSVFLKTRAKDTSANAGITNHPNNDGIMTLAIDKSSYGKRQRVDLIIKAIPKTGLQGTLSLSIRKKETLPNAGRKTIAEFLGNKPSPSKRSAMPFLPETRGDLISGKIISDQDDLSRKLMIFLPGENNVFKIATPDTNGTFNTEVQHSFTGNTIYITPTGIREEATRIELENDTVTDFGNLEFFHFQLDEAMKGAILERSIQNQIENAYFQNRPDSILQAKPSEPFYQGPMTNYDLDDYTRFPTLRETFVEILEHVWIEDGKNGQVDFKVRPALPLQDSGERPLVLLDGAFIDDHGKLLGLPSKAIKNIKIGRDQYLYGSYAFQGIIDITTMEGNTFINYLDSATQAFSYAPPRLKKNYYKEDYSGERFEDKKHLPDFRRQLAWIPEIEMNGDDLMTHFFTSDLTGEFEIILEGISRSGIPVSKKISFTVE